MPGHAVSLAGSPIHPVAPKRLQPRKAFQQSWLPSLAPIWYVFAQLNRAFLSAGGQMGAIRNTTFSKQAEPLQPRRWGQDRDFRWLLRSAGRC